MAAPRLPPTPLHPHPTPQPAYSLGSPISAEVQPASQGHEPQHRRQAPWHLPTHASKLSPNPKYSPNLPTAPAPRQHPQLLPLLPPSPDGVPHPQPAPLEQPQRPSPLHTRIPAKNCPPGAAQMLLPGQVPPSPNEIRSLFQAPMI